MTENAPKIYLAGPMVFYPDCDAVFARMKAVCASVGLEGVAPVDGQLDLAGIPPGRLLYTKIVAADFALCDGCDGAIVCLDPFHGTVEMDAGTAVEIGYLHARGKPMEGWTSRTDTFGERVLAFSGGGATTSANAVGATSGTARDPDGMLIHSGDLAQHGMAQMPIEMGGGSVHAYADPLTAFHIAAVALARRLGTVPHE